MPIPIQAHWIDEDQRAAERVEVQAHRIDVPGRVALEPERARYHSFAGLTATCNAISKSHSAETRNRVELEMGKALAAFEQAVILDPEFHKARLELIHLLLKTAPEHGGRRAQAVHHVEVLEGKDPIHGVAGRCMLLAENESAKKVELWQQTVAAHPKRADARAGLARACLLAGEIELALPHIDEAIRLDPSRSIILLTLCREYVSKGDHDRAQEAVERFLAATPPPPVPLRAYGTFCLAQLQRMQGDDERAETLMAEAKKLDPRCWNTYMEPAEELFEKP